MRPHPLTARAAETKQHGCHWASCVRGFCQGLHMQGVSRLRFSGACVVLSLQPLSTLASGPKLEERMLGWRLAMSLPGGDQVTAFKWRTKTAVLLCCTSQAWCACAASRDGLRRGARFGRAYSALRDSWTMRWATAARLSVIFRRPCILRLWRCTKRSREECLRWLQGTTLDISLGVDVLRTYSDTTTQLQPLSMTFST